MTNPERSLNDDFQDFLFLEIYYTKTCFILAELASINFHSTNELISQKKPINYLANVILTDFLYFCHL